MWHLNVWQNLTFLCIDLLFFTHLLAFFLSFFPFFLFLTICKYIISLPSYFFRFLFSSVFPHLRSAARYTCNAFFGTSTHISLPALTYFLPVGSSDYLITQPEINNTKPLLAFQWLYYEFNCCFGGRCHIKPFLVWEAVKPCFICLCSL
jgi:hypothetical protein